MDRPRYSGNVYVIECKDLDPQPWKYSKYSL